MWKEFKAFALKGNLVDLAVAFVLGLAFAAVVNALVANVVMPLVAAIFGQPNFDALTFKVGDGVIAYGVFLTALVNFLIVALVLFAIVKAYQQATRPRGAEPEPPTLRACPHCISDIPVRASRCPHCTSEIQPEAA